MLAWFVSRISLIANEAFRVAFVRLSFLMILFWTVDFALMYDSCLDLDKVHVWSIGLLPARGHRPQASPCDLRVCDHGSYYFPIAFCLNFWLYNHLSEQILLADVYIIDPVPILYRFENVVIYEINLYGDNRSFLLLLISRQAIQSGIFCKESVWITVNVC